MEHPVYIYIYKIKNQYPQTRNLILIDHIIAMTELARVTGNHLLSTVANVMWNVTVLHKYQQRPRAR